MYPCFTSVRLGTVSLGYNKYNRICRQIILFSASKMFFFGENDTKMFGYSKMQECAEMKIIFFSKNLREYQSFLVSKPYKVIFHPFLGSKLAQNVTKTNKKVKLLIHLNTKHIKWKKSYNQKYDSRGLFWAPKNFQVNFPMLYVTYIFYECLF